MTTRERINTALIRAIVETYSMQEGDIQALLNEIARQTTIVYRQTVQSSLALYGCQKIVTGPDSVAQEWIDAKALKDAKGIATTYQNELENKVIALYRANPRGNRNYYSSNLNSWIALRSSRKSTSISLNTMTQARQYAQDRFAKENNITGKWVLVGPPVTCKDCVRIRALGPVDFATTQKARNKLPFHVNCPHRWGQLVPKKIDCAEAWTG